MLPCAGRREEREVNKVLFDGVAVHAQTPLHELPDDAAVILEFKHYYRFAVSQTYLPTGTDDPRHSLHLERTRPCTQIEPPPHSLHVERIRPCTQIEPPPHSLHVERTRPCTQIDAPPHSLH